MMMMTMMMSRPKALAVVSVGRLLGHPPLLRSRLCSSRLTMALGTCAGAHRALHPIGIGRLRFSFVLRFSTRDLTVVRRQRESRGCIGARGLSLGICHLWTDLSPACA